MGVLNLAIVIPQVWLPFHFFILCAYLALILNGNQFIFMIDVLLYQVFGMTDY
jgi:hypothetical protein